MLDIFTGSTHDIDWLHVQRMLDRVLTRFLNAWVPCMLIITPLIVVGWGYGADTIRSLALFLFVGIGALAWLGRAVVARRKIMWRKSAFGSVGLALFVVLLASSAVSGAWSFTGAGAFGALGLAFLVIQHAGIRTGRVEALFTFYVASVCLLAAATLAASIVAGESLSLAAALTTQALMTAASAVLAAALASQEMPRPNWRRTAWAVAAAANVLLLAYYDYGPAWWLLIGGCVLWFVLVRSNPRTPSSFPFSKGGGHVPPPLTKGRAGVGLGGLPIAFALFAAVFLFLPIRSYLPGTGINEANIQTVPVRVVVSRFFQYNPPETIALGAGLGRETEAFWSLAEMVDFRSVSALPPLGGGFSTMLWGTGALGTVSLALLAAVLAAHAFGFLRLYIRRRLLISPSTLFSILGFALSLAAFALSPFSSFSLFALLIFSALVAAALVEQRSIASTAADPRQWRALALVEGGFALAASRLALAVGIVALVLYAIVSFSLVVGRSRFVSAVAVDDGGIIIDTGLLAKVINASPRSHQYRLARIDFFTQSILERAGQVEPELLRGSLQSVAADMAVLLETGGRAVRGIESWAIGYHAERIGVALAASRDSARPEPSAEDATSAAFWFGAAREWYGRSLELLTRNVILYTDVARFFRTRASDLAGGAAAEGSALEAQYQKALSVVERAIAIDSTYEPALFEKSEILALLGRSDEAVEVLRGIAGANAAGAYQAGRLELSAQKLVEARGYFEQTIALNPNHLQARYDLVQVLMALSDMEGAKRELDALAERISEEDFQGKALVEGLRSLLGGE